jgi:hypothetical protein
MDEEPEHLEDEAQHAPPRPIDKFKHTAAGSVVAAGLFGLRDALEGRPEREEVAIVNEAPSARAPEGFRLVFDEETGQVTVVVPDPIPPDDYQR